MKMKLYQDLTLKFESPDWANNPEFGLMDSILEKRPDLLAILEGDIAKGQKKSNLGRGDAPSVEQIVRAALYKELKQLTYRELEYHQGDSRICSLFLKIDRLRPHSFQVYQKYISMIREENLQRFLVELNKIAIAEGLEDLEKIRQDSTVVETDIHWPTNNSLVWDCIRESHRLPGHLGREIGGLDYRDYPRGRKGPISRLTISRPATNAPTFSKNSSPPSPNAPTSLSNVVKKYGYSIKGMILAMEMRGMP